jgi:Eukaryotic aspartyl protease
VKDDLRVGGITVEGQAIEIAEDVHPSFVSGEGDGLLGLAFGNINSVRPQKVKTPVENMIIQKDIPEDQELFTCKLGSWRDREDEPDKGESFYTFGFIDQETVKATGEEIFYTKVFPKGGFWQFESTSATVNGSKIRRPHNMAIADTGTTLALIDDKTVEAIYKAIPGAKFDEANQAWVYPAETKEDKLPVVTLAVGTKQFVIQKEDLGFVGFKDNQGKTWVYGGIQSRGDSDIDILGDTFLKGIYAVRDS